MSKQGVLTPERSNASLRSYYATGSSVFSGYKQVPFFEHQAYRSTRAQLGTLSSERSQSSSWKRSSQYQSIGSLTKSEGLCSEDIPYVALEEDSLKHSPTIKRIEELMSEDYEDEEDVVKPSSYAFKKAIKIVSSAQKLIGFQFPLGTVLPDAEGGIRVRWRSLEPKREVRLYCASHHTKKTYIYHESGEEFDVAYRISGRSLAKWLRWLRDA